ncbi:hypothetical protein MCOR31_007775 [Pyricularia oryzae]|nr:hypothetical protein MCOR31_007775 [Pyricularia oryzae]KAI6410047.1 hypothetical protein MCOR20_004786 [Pyricularia oryzae]KAI6433153.1 hypothetical protein MCOR24_001375 [Pyricularia oryzae]KAI6480575.1 hypothetical protein MCOR11_011616 [Pyricularia oryzae]
MRAAVALGCKVCEVKINAIIEMGFKSRGAPVPPEDNTTAIETILAARPSFVNSDPDSQAFCWMLGTTVRLTRATSVCTGSLSAFAIRWNNRHISYMPANEQHLKAEGLLVRKIDGPLPSLIQLPESFSGAEVYEMVGSWSVWVMYDDLTDEELPLFPPLPAIDELLSGESTETIVII